MPIALFIADRRALRGLAEASDAAPSATTVKVKGGDLRRVLAILKRAGLH